jgi:hypothetical protein
MYQERFPRGLSCMRCIRLHLTIPDRPAAAVYTTLAAARGSDPSPSASARVSRWDSTGPDGRQFVGSWSCVDDGCDTALTFAGRLDMGTVPVTGASEPQAVRTLIDDTVATVTSLFDGNVRVDDVVIQAHGCEDQSPAA